MISDLTLTIIITLCFVGGLGLGFVCGVAHGRDSRVPPKQKNARH